MQAVGQVGQAHHLPAEMGSQFFATLQRAVGDHDRVGLACGEMGRAQLDHLAGTHEQQSHLAQVFKQLTCQPHGRSGHADRVGADFGG